jgi:chromosome segregation ATPase
MDIDQLKSSIRELHADLENTGEADPELKRLLKDLDDDLHRLLAARAEVERDQSGLQERLESLAADFDTQHPKLAAALRELGVALARVGI